MIQTLSLSPCQTSTLRRRSIDSWGQRLCGEGRPRRGYGCCQASGRFGCDQPGPKYGQPVSFCCDSQGSLRREKPGDVQYQMRRVRHECADGTIGGGNNRHVGGDCAISGIQRRDNWLRCTLRPKRQEAKRARRNNRGVEHIRLGCRRSSAAARANIYVKYSREWRSPRGNSRVFYPAGVDGEKR